MPLIERCRRARLASRSPPGYVEPPLAREAAQRADHLTLPATAPKGACVQGIHAEPCPMTAWRPTRRSRQPQKPCKYEPSDLQDGRTGRQGLSHKPTTKALQVVRIMELGDSLKGLRRLITREDADARDGRQEHLRIGPPRRLQLVRRTRVPEAIEDAACKRNSARRVSRIDRSSDSSIPWRAKHPPARPRALLASTRGKSRSARLLVVRSRRLVVDCRDARSQANVEARDRRSIRRILSRGGPAR